MVPVVGGNNTDVGNCLATQQIAPVHRPVPFTDTVASGEVRPSAGIRLGNGYEPQAPRVGFGVPPVDISSTLSGADENCGDRLHPLQRIGGGSDERCGIGIVRAGKERS